MHYLLCSWSLSSLKHLLSFRCLFHYGFSLALSQESRHLCVELFSFFSLSLSFSLPFLLLVFLLLIPRCMFTWMLLPVLLSGQAGGLFATELPSSPPSHRPGFLSLRVFFPPLFPSSSVLHRLKANRGFITLKRTRRPQQPDPQSCCTKPFHLWTGSKSANPYRSHLGPLWFVIFLFIYFSTVIMAPPQESFPSPAVLCSSAKAHSHSLIQIHPEANSQQCKHVLQLNRMRKHNLWVPWPSCPAHLCSLICRFISRRRPDRVKAPSVTITPHSSKAQPIWRGRHAEPLNSFCDSLLPLFLFLQFKSLNLNLFWSDLSQYLLFFSSPAVVGTARDAISMQKICCQGNRGERAREAELSPEYQECRCRRRRAQRSTLSASL